MKKILLILVGGTICTSLNEHGTLSISKGAGIRLIENFKSSHSPFKNDIQITPTPNLFILSENMSISNWNLMLDTYRKYINTDNFDGVIFAHGTDTLAYSTALFSLILANTDIPVFFVSSNARLDSERANGNDNFRYAVELICKGIKPNVYATYKNISDGRMYLHLGSRLEQCKNYSEDFFSNGAIDITDGFDQALKLKKGKTPLININGDWHLENKVLMITPYVGLDYNSFNYSKFSAILHGTYHSGTACTEPYNENSVLYLMELSPKENPDIDIYLSPSKNEGEVYDTVRVIGNHKANEKKINFLYGYTNEYTYAKLVLAYSLFKDKKDIEEFINE
ncbi:MAG: asparaginase [Clostridia bacterium]|nr:asparaginase [Clostridia bacterium]